MPDLHLPSYPHSPLDSTADRGSRPCSLRRAGIPYHSLHDLRRSIACLAQRAGIDEAIVKDLGEWSTIGVVEKHYTGEVPEVSRRAMPTLDAAQEVA